MSFYRVVPRRGIKWNNDTVDAKSTLEDEADPARKAHIVLHNGRYVLLTQVGDGECVTEPSWFREAVRALRDLPLPEENEK